MREKGEGVYAWCCVKMLLVEGEGVIGDGRLVCVGLCQDVIVRGG